MNTISLCMIVRDEEDTLARCLSSVADIADEIIVADTGSRDRTKEIAAQFTDKIYDFEWVDDFSAARNFSFSKATSDFVMWLDADDILLPDDAVKLRELKQSLPSQVDAVMMKYNTGFDAQGRVTFSYFRERLARRSVNPVWREPVHEYLEIPGRRISVDIAVTHAKPHGRASARNLRIYEDILSGGGRLTSRGTYYYARELKDSARYADAIVRFEEFLDGGRGWAEDNINACGEIAQCRIALGEENAALAPLFRSFIYDEPRAEICCQIGYIFKSRGLYSRAAFWFELVLALERTSSGWGFRREDCWGYIPCIELAVCYDKLGQYDKAARYNEMAGAFKPDSSAYLNNKRYFGARLMESAPQ